MPAQVETGKSNILQPAHSLVFEGYHRDATQSIGLSFEPNFFTTWLYGDKLGSTLIAEERYPIHGLDWKAIIKSLPMEYVAFGLTHGERFTLMPTAVFEEDCSEAFLKFNTAYSGAGNWNYDHIHLLGITVLYEDEMKAQKIADEHFTGLKIQHAVSHLIQSLHKAAGKGGVQMFVYNCDTHYYFIVFKDTRLVLANALNAISNEDVIYYLLYTLKQIEEKNDCEVVLLGNTNTMTDLKSKLETYLPNVNIGIAGSRIGMKGIRNNEDFGNFFMAYTGQLCV